EADMVGVVVPTERDGEPVDRDAIELSRVAIRLLDLADQRTVHRRIPPSPARAEPRPRSGRCTFRPVGAVVGVHLTPVPTLRSPPFRRLELVTSVGFGDDVGCRAWTPLGALSPPPRAPAPAGAPPFGAPP